MNKKKENRDEIRKNICVPMSKAEREAVISEAKKAGLATATFMRMSILEKIKKKEG